ncbi:MAG: ceramidase domain-containing protein [Arenimonas sp.]
MLILVIGSLIFLMMQAPIRQDQTYHAFIDVRSMCGIPNFYNVISNLPFLLVGLAGSIFCCREASGQSKTAWLIFFIGIGLVGFGSAYYHLDPSNQRLLWDRLPMTIGFMGSFTALLGELVEARLTKHLLFPSILVGIGSVLVWHWYDDLRLYVWVQFMPLLVVPALLLLYRGRYSHLYLLMLALVFYFLAKMLEAFDAQIFSLLQEGMAGHAIKHVFAALGSAMILWMLRVRKPFE